MWTDVNDMLSHNVLKVFWLVYTDQCMCIKIALELKNSIYVYVYFNFILQ